MSAVVNPPAGALISASCVFCSLPTTATPPPTTHNPPLHYCTVFCELSWAPIMCILHASAARASKGGPAPTTWSEVVGILTTGVSWRLQQLPRGPHPRGVKRKVPNRDIAAPWWVTRPLYRKTALEEPARTRDAYVEAPMAAVLW